MDKFKNKYEIILGFAALIISLSAYKEELSSLSINLGFVLFNLKEYSVFLVSGFSFCIYLYIVETIFRDTRFGNMKLFDYLIYLAYFLFVLLISTPVIILVNYTFILVYEWSLAKEETINYLSNITTIISALLGAIVSFSNARIVIRNKQKILEEEASELEIKELENAQKLYLDGYYSHSILESFKVIQTHLHKKLLNLNIRAVKGNTVNLIQAALENQILSKNDVDRLNEIRAMRNSAAHLDVEHTKQQAESSITTVRDLLKK